MNYFQFLITIFISLSLQACQSTKTESIQESSLQDEQEALQSVAGAITGSTVTEKDLKDVGRQVQRNPEARSAVESISSSLDSTNQKIKYCPETGERFAAHLEYCPGSETKLEWVQ